MRFHSRYFAKRINNVLVYKYVVFDTYEERIISVLNGTFNTDTLENTTVINNIYENNIYIYDYFNTLESNGYIYIPLKK